ncbi:pyruvate, phosphate dikinase [Clostridium sp. Cult2]|uniref:pyruvate, phosphate dikinase n=1 Tax=Clostridium sp. Cult2 TaxID=2079003 RepID=UPI0030139ED6|nr:pyruvate, phosphate dikinase [Clostridium sp. Cult2]
MTRYVYQFNEGNKKMKDLLGGKGANLAEMTNIGLPVPPGFTVTTEVCKRFYTKGKKIDEDLKKEILHNLSILEKKVGKNLGDDENPLLLSVRSGAPISMPGMMDTVLNIGLNDTTVEIFAKATSNERTAYDSYRRLIQMFGDVVMNIPIEKFESILDEAKENKGYENDLQLTTDDLKKIVKKYKELYKKEIGEEFPQDSRTQLLMSISAVFKSWHNDRAIAYRNINKISHDMGTAVNVQTMVFGNMGDDSATGVMFTRNPATGDNNMYGEFLVNAQGEDVVAGIRTPQNIDKLKSVFPEKYDELKEVAEKLEDHYKEMQDVEFTIEKGKLYILQTRDGKRTGMSAVNIAVEMVEEGLIDKRTAVMRVEPLSVKQLLHPTFDNEDLKKAKVIAEGLAASPGAVYGKIYFASDDVVEAVEKGEDAVLVRSETSADDIHGMYKAKGFLTAKGGMTSHAAVVARQMGKSCVSGCNNINVDEKEKKLTINGKAYNEGDYISLDGNTGKVYEGKIKTKDAEIIGNFRKLLKWADEFRRLEIWTNVDKSEDLAKALKFGAEGIGLCRTEHMFFGEDRINYVRRLVIEEDDEKIKEVLDKLFEFQKDDFYHLFKDMDNRSIIIRLLDLPLHEFLPSSDKDINAMAEKMDMEFKDIKYIVNSLKEYNPMLGHRGCRLGMTNPEIYEMQTRAIITAAVEVEKELNIAIVPQIMLPLVGIEEEIATIRKNVTKVADEIIKEKGSNLRYEVGTMIEIPRAALLADDIAKHADFFSFGTNDLTQMTFGFSRDDADMYLKSYIEQGVFNVSPFESIDTKGVGKLMDMTVKLGRMVNPKLHIGICGEHAGDPDSISFCDKIGLDYVSCSPYLVPVARLAAAQAAIKNA